MKKRITAVTLLLIILLLSFASCGKTEDNQPLIVAVNQVGYLPDKVKIAQVTGGGNNFEVISADTEQTVFTGTVQEGWYDAASDDKVNFCDFSEFTVPGTYYLSVDGKVKSYTFEIGDDIYDEFFNELLLTIFYQRCGYELPDGYENPYMHEACHLGTHYIMAEKSEGREVAYEYDVTGGWHDAGDYSVQGVSNSLTASLLMYTYLAYPDVVSGDSVGIPESNNGIPDILDEARWGIEWLMKMQTEDGGVMRRIDEWGHPPLDLRADLDDSHKYVLPVCYGDTGNMAATCALASRVYRDIDPEFADKCLEAAKRAYDWMLENPDYEYVFPTNYWGYSYEYHGVSEQDEFLWAKTELFAATNDAKYLDGVAELITTEDLTGMSYHDRGGMALFAFATSSDADWDMDLVSAMRLSFKKSVNAEARLVDESPWLVPMDMERLQYEYRFNSIFSRTITRMTLVENMYDSQDYTDSKIGWLNFVFGSNPLNLCYVSGHGTNTAQYYHHRNCALGNMFPGVISPGPGSFSAIVAYGITDLADYISPDTPMLKCYAEDINLYHMNEWTVDESGHYIWIMAGLLSDK